MKLQIFHTVNEGLYLWNGKSGLLIDALHGGVSEGFSNMPEKYKRLMTEKKSIFRKTNDVLFTHLHDDHYDAELVGIFAGLNPDSYFYGPGLEKNNTSVVQSNNGLDFMKMRDYNIIAFHTKHDGKPYVGYPHRSYIVEWEDERIWVSGDALFSDELAEDVLDTCGGKRIDRAFVNVYQIGSRNNLSFLQKIHPKEIYLYHLPYPEDDKARYYHLAKGCISKCARMGIEVKQLQQDSFMDGGQKSEDS